MALSNWPLRVCHCEFVVLSTFKYGICQFASMLKGHCPPRFCGLLLAARHFKHCRISYSFILLAIRIKLRVRERGIFGSVIFARKTFRGKHGYLSPKKEGEITLLLPACNALQENRFTKYPPSFHFIVAFVISMLRHLVEN